MTLKELLGDAYKDDITIAEIDEILKSKKLVDLKSGNYVDKDKYEKAVNRQTELEQELTGLRDSTKDYQELVNFKKSTELEKQKAETIQALKDVGFKDEFMDYALFQVESGKIARDDNFVANAKKFLDENKQYAKEVANPTPNPTPTINTIFGSDSLKGQQPIQPTAQVKSWNKNRS